MNNWKHWTDIPQEVVESYMKDSFFLPREILQAANAFGWMIPDIQVIPSIGFINSVRDLHNIPEFKGLKYEPSLEIVATGERVGIAIRRHEQQQKLYVICKIWYDSKNKEKQHGN